MVSINPKTGELNINGNNVTIKLHNKNIPKKTKLKLIEGMRKAGVKNIQMPDFWWNDNTEDKIDKEEIPAPGREDIQAGTDKSHEIGGKVFNKNIEAKKRELQILNEALMNTKDDSIKSQLEKEYSLASEDLKTMIKDNVRPEWDSTDFRRVLNYNQYVKPKGAREAYFAKMNPEAYKESKLTTIINAKSRLEQIKKTIDNARTEGYKAKLQTDKLPEIMSLSATIKEAEDKIENPELKYIVPPKGATSLDKVNYSMYNDNLKEDYSNFDKDKRKKYD